MPAFSAREQFNSQKMAAGVLYGIVVVSLLLVWLNQESIRLYCQQKYHAGCEIPGLSQSPTWQFGAQLNHALSDARTAFVSSLDRQRAVAVMAEVEAVVPAPETLPVAPQVLTPQTVVLPGGTLPGPLMSLEDGDQVFFVGDSLMQGVAPHMANTLRKRFKIKSVNLSRQSTGLAYPSFFNWPQTVTDTLRLNPKIRLIVVFLGPNDPWDMPAGRGKPFLKFKTPEWEDAYRQRIEAVLEGAREHDVQVIWVGPPNMHKERLSSAMAYLSELYKSEAERYRQHYLSANAVLGYENDGFSYYRVDEDGKKIKTRVDDGIHFTITGQKLIAEHVLSLISFPSHELTEQ